MNLIDKLAGQSRSAVGPLDAPSGRTAIIDIGSNSVRLVVFAGARRLPFILFNEKVMAGLGSELSETGRMGERAMSRALSALERFARLCSEMGVEDVRCVATAAARDAQNGADFIARVEAIGLDVRLLSGKEEGTASAYGLLSGMPDADGIIGDLGGGSLELARVSQGRVHQSASLPLGVLRVPEIRRAGRDALARRLDDLLGVSGMDKVERGLPFYMIGGSWRALARLDMQLTNYTLPIIHHYDMAPGRVGVLLDWLDQASKADVKAMPQVSTSRFSTMPDAAHLLAALIGRFDIPRLTVSAFGLREGLLYTALPPDVAAQDPLLAAARAEGDAQGRFWGHGDQINRWIAPLFAQGGPQQDGPQWARIRHAACLLADVSWRANPEFRAERGLEVALHGNWVGITAQERAVLAQALHANFGGGSSIVPELTKLAPSELLERGVHWGLAIRLCQRLSGGAAGPLEGSRLVIEGGTVILRLLPGHACLAGETIERRLRQLGQAMGMDVLLDA